MRRRLTLVVAIGTAGALALVSGAPAAVSLSASSGTAGFSTTLDGADNASSAYTVGLTVANGGGTKSSGWNLQVTSTTFTDGAKTLPVAATAITGVAVGSCSGTACPTNSVAWPVAVPAGASAPAAVSFFNAAAGTGTGTVTVTPSVVTTVPGNTFAGSYTSTVTFSVVVGP
jgi:hypothetical protein